MPRTRHSSPHTLRVLAFLSLQDDTYGWQLAKETNLPETTVYGILKRLKEDGYVTTYWDIEGVEKPATSHLPSYLQPLDEGESCTASPRKGATRQCFRITGEGILFTKVLRERLAKRKTTWLI
jgi:hypothetical protein